MLNVESGRKVDLLINLVFLSRPLKFWRGSVIFWRLAHFAPHKTLTPTRLCLTQSSKQDTVNSNQGTAVDQE